MKKIQIILAVSSILFTFSVSYMIRREILELKYALLWLISGLGLILLSISPLVSIMLADLFGIVDANNVLFLLGIIFLIAIVFSLTLSLSRSSKKVLKLTQEVALLKNDIEKISRKISE